MTVEEQHQPPDSRPEHPGPPGRSRRDVGRGHRARQARRWPTGREAARFAEATRLRCAQHRILGLAAEVGFWQLVSLPSLLLAVFGAIGYFSGIVGAADIDRVRNDVLNVFSQFLSTSTVRSDVAPIVDDILSRGHAATLSISFVISLWSGSSAMSDYVNTITVAYGMRGLRTAVRSRLLALGLYVAAIVAGTVLIPAAVLGPGVIVELFPRSAEAAASGVVHAAYWPGLIILSVLFVTTLYVVSLPRRVSWVRQLPGAIVAVSIWVGGSVVLRIYVGDRDEGAFYYGALAAPLAGLLFFYVTALAVLLGAEINAERHARLGDHPHGHDAAAAAGHDAAAAAGHDAAAAAGHDAAAAGHDAAAAAGHDAAAAGHDAAAAAGHDAAADGDGDGDGVGADIVSSRGLTGSE